MIFQFGLLAHKPQKWQKINTFIYKLKFFIKEVNYKIEYFQHSLITKNKH